MSEERDASPGLHLFEGFGVELEYMIVDRESGAVAPLSDRLIEAAAGSIEAEIERGELAWSNELVLHAIELKTNGPAPALAPLAQLFTRDLGEIDRLLEPMGARLWPTAMHPLMQPERDTKLWPHDYGEVYRAFDRIFDCRGHGWSNLQSTHLNLPFQGPVEFGRLHAAIRLALPLLPALAASSPVVEGQLTGVSDNRLAFYRDNCARLPVVTGRVVPEAVDTPDEYVAAILDPIARAIAPLDPDGVLEAEWVNARGAIARLERESIEIRVLDVQEHAAADLAIVAVVVALLRGLVEERWASRATQRALATERLESVLLRCVREGSHALVDDRDYLGALGVAAEPVTARALWQKLVERALASKLMPERPEWTDALSVILERGTLSDRIVARLGSSPTREAIVELWDELGACLLDGRPFGGK
jgi:carboxylate-amine ligase